MESKKTMEKTNIVLRTWDVVKVCGRPCDEPKKVRTVISPMDVTIVDFSTAPKSWNPQIKEYITNQMQALQTNWNWQPIWFNKGYSPNLAKMIRARSAAAELIQLYKAYTNPVGLIVRFIYLGDTTEDTSKYRFKLLRDRIIGPQNIILTHHGVIVYPHWYWPVFNTLKRSHWPIFPKDLWKIIFRHFISW